MPILIIRRFFKALAHPGTGYPHPLENFPGKSTCALPLLVGFDPVEVEHGGRPSAMGDVEPGASCTER